MPRNMVDTERGELPEAQSTQAGSLHIVYPGLQCQPGPLASFEGCNDHEAGMGWSPRRRRRCLGGRTCIMCPDPGPGQVPPQVGTAKGLLVLQWPEARAAAQGGRTRASTVGSASSSGPVVISGHSALSRRP